MTTIHGFTHYLVGHDDLVTALTAPLASTAANATIAVTAGDGAKIQASLDAAGSGTGVYALLVDAVTPTQVELVALTSVATDTVTLGERALDGTTAHTFASGSTVAIVIGAEIISRLVRALRDHDTLSHNVRAFGALGDIQTITDAAMSTGPGVGDTTKTLSSATGPFVAGDVGKYVEVYDALGSGLPLRTTIASYRSSTKVELTAACTTTVSSKIAYWGTDDTLAIQAAITAASLTVGGEVYFPPGNYYLTSSNPPLTQYATHIANPIKLRGSGRKTSIIRLHPANYHFFVFERSATVEHLGFHAAPAAVNSSNQVLRLDYDPTNSLRPSTRTGNVDIVVRDCDFLNVNGGLYVNGYDSSVVTRWVDSVLVEDNYVLINPLRTGGDSGVNPCVYIVLASQVTIRHNRLDTNETNPAHTGGSLCNNIYTYDISQIHVVENYLIKGICTFNTDAHGDTSLIEFRGNHCSQMANSVLFLGAGSHNVNLFLVADNYFANSRNVDTSTGDLHVTSTGTCEIMSLVVRNNTWASCSRTPIFLNPGAAMTISSFITQGNYYQSWGADAAADCIVVGSAGTKKVWVSMGDVADAAGNSNSTRYHAYDGSGANDFAKLTIIGLVDLAANASNGTTNSTSLMVTPDTGGSTNNLTTYLNTGNGPSARAVARWARWSDGATKGFVPIFE